ncbi:MAG: ComEA family DNA-binding protein [Lachnospiraceae bacterium]|nr:ComEA family DNA-binding protein [Lachnospiraceae bacterium]
MNKIRFLTVYILIQLTLIFSGCEKQSYLSSKTDVIIESNAGSEEPKEEQEDLSSIFVQVDGAVKSPGVFELPKGARVFHAIEAAGGLKKNADKAALNQADILSDTQQITVLTKKEVNRAAEGTGQGADDLVNINTADKAALMTLPGIGESKAGAIIIYRQEHGGFKLKDDLKKVSGIGEAIYNKVSNIICI